MANKNGVVIKFHAALQPESLTQAPLDSVAVFGARNASRRGKGRLPFAIRSGESNNVEPSPARISSLVKNFLKELAAAQNNRAWQSPAPLFFTRR